MKLWFSGVANTAIFVELENTVEGIIPLSEMKERLFIYYKGAILRYRGAHEAAHKPGRCGAGKGAGCGCGACARGIYAAWFFRRKRAGEGKRR